MHRELRDKGTYHFLMLLLPRIVKVKVEIRNCHGTVMITMMENIFDDRAAQNGLAASRDSM